MNATPDMMTAGLKMIASLGVVLAVILFLLYGMRKVSLRGIGSHQGKRIQVLESHYLGVKKNICLVRVPGKVLVVGVTNDRISLLDTLDDTVVWSEDEPERPKSFSPVLSEKLKEIGSRFKGKEKT